MTTAGGTTFPSPTAVEAHVLTICERVKEKDTNLHNNQRTTKNQKGKVPKAS